MSAPTRTPLQLSNAPHTLHDSAWAHRACLANYNRVRVRQRTEHTLANSWHRRSNASAHINRSVPARRGVLTCMRCCRRAAPGNVQRRTRHPRRPTATQRSARHAMQHTAANGVCIATQWGALQRNAVQCRAAEHHSMRCNRTHRTASMCNNPSEHAITSTV